MRRLSDEIRETVTGLLAALRGAGGLNGMESTPPFFQHCPRPMAETNS